MFHRASPHAHRLRRGALLHPLERLLVPMTADGTSRRLRTAHLQRTRATDSRPGQVHHSSPLFLFVVAGERLLRRTAEAVGLLVVAKRAAVKQAAVALIVRPARHRYMRL